jgi:hypothetical protein
MGKPHHKLFLPASLLIITLGYFLMLIISKPQVFSYVFDTSLIGKYFLSQDITYEPNGRRLFLSDSDIHIATGYMYVTGSDAATYNFQHPPLLKYLYGYVALIFRNPLLMQVGLGWLFLILTYYIGRRVYPSLWVPLIACLLIILDPLFKDAVSQALLDLGQGVFILLYFITIFFLKNKYWLQGAVLGLLLASKFWGSSLFFIFVIAAYLIITGQFKWKHYIYHWLVALTIFALVYLPTFVYRQGKFNLIFFELKTLKYWLNHSVASVFGSSLGLFITGFYKSWWGNRQILRSDIWSVWWPIGIIISLWISWRQVIIRKLTIKWLIAVIPWVYLLYLGFQAPFTRYFILILPFLYLTITDYGYRLVKRCISQSGS